MTQKGIPDVSALREYFTLRVQGIANSLSLDVLMWEVRMSWRPQSRVANSSMRLQEVFTNNFTYLDTSIVTPWITPDVTKNATAKNLRVVNYFSYYLDQHIPPGAVDPPYTGETYYFWVDTWQTFYKYDPVYSSGMDAQQAPLVLGGTASLWGEQADASGAGMQATARAWPRAAATSERLWSPNRTYDIMEVTERLEHFRCHIAQRGVPAGPLTVASNFGFCWSPAWAGVSAPTESTGSAAVSAGAAAGIAVGSAVIGALMLLAFQRIVSRPSTGYRNIAPAAELGGDSNAASLMPRTEVTLAVSKSYGSAGTS
jgi:hypothetical protein